MVFSGVIILKRLANRTNEVNLVEDVNGLVTPKSYVPTLATMQIIGPIVWICSPFGQIGCVVQIPKKDKNVWMLAGLLACAKPIYTIDFIEF